MATVDQDLARETIKKLETQKRPKMYCVARYQNRLNGDSNKGTYSGFALCYRKKDYENLLSSPVVGGIDILWKSRAFEKDQEEFV